MNIKESVLNSIKEFSASHKLLGKEERLIANTLLAIALVFRVIEIFLRSFDSDEPQHLHVVWGWAHGYIQYRDIFDNHAPLFHLLFAPLFALLPEWYGGIYVMRIAVLPFYFLTLICTFLIAKNIYSHRTALWSVIILALYSEFLTKMLEFRPDCLWTALLTFSVYLFVRNQKLSKRTSFLMGLALGAALSVSFKTIIFLAALLIAIIVTRVSEGNQKLLFTRESIANFGFAIVGFLVIPMTIIAGFYFLNALPDIYYGVIKHNTLAHTQKTLDSYAVAHKVATLVLWLVITAAISQYALRSTQYIAQRSKRLLVLCCGASFFAILHTFWPLVTPQTELPGLPMLVISITPFFTSDFLLLNNKWLHPVNSGKYLAKHSTMVILLLVALIEISFLPVLSGVAKKHKIQGTQLWEDVLTFTDPGDYVMDAKGETIFRMRPYYYGLETITMQLIGSGAIPDNSSASLVAKPTYIIATKYFYRYPGKLKTFIIDNYLPSNTLYVAGKKLPIKEFKQNQPVQFDILLPGKYAFISNGNLVSGDLDGKLGSGVFDIKAGHHKFIPANNGSSLIIVWAKAWKRGIKVKELSNLDERAV